MFRETSLSKDEESFYCNLLISWRSRLVKYHKSNRKKEYSKARLIKLFKTGIVFLKKEHILQFLLSILCFGGQFREQLRSTLG